MPVSIAAFFSKWLTRARAFAMLAGAWGVLFSAITLTGLKIGFEYDDGLVFSTPAFKSAQFPAYGGARAEKPAGAEAYAGPAGADYWNAVNRGYGTEHTKPVPWLTAWFFKILGFKIEIFCGRGREGSDSLENSWKPPADLFHFTQDENTKYELLEKGRFILYFTPSDEGVIQAKKAGVTPVRIRKNRKSSNPCSYTPGKFGEHILPLSEF